MRGMQLVSLLVKKSWANNALEVQMMLFEHANVKMLQDS